MSKRYESNKKADCDEVDFALKNNTEREESALILARNILGQTDPFAILNMDEVAEKISLRDSEAAKRWCLANNISVHRFTKRDIVYLFDLQCIIGKPFVISLKNRLPDHWCEILQDLLDSNALYKYFMITLENDESYFNQIGAVDAQQEQLLKRLMR